MGEGGGVSLRQLILKTWPQAVRQMRGVGRGEGGGGERGDMKQITAHSNPYSSFSLSFCPLCIRRGFDKNFARGCAEQCNTCTKGSHLEALRRCSEKLLISCSNSSFLECAHTVFHWTKEIDRDIFALPIFTRWLIFVQFANY